MCGFFFTDDIDQLSDLEFADVKQRGTKFFEFSFKNYYGVQSILPSCSGHYSFIETEEWKFFFTGQVYNYDRSYKNDTEYVFEQLILNINNVNKFNGMFAFVLVNKKTEDIYIARDKTGQIPLFYYIKDRLIVSNTIKSIVKNTNTNIRTNLLTDWNKSKHYITLDTPWQDIKEFPPGKLYCNGNITTIFGPRFETYDVYETLCRLKESYKSPLESYNIFSGGVDSSIVSEIFGYEKIAINNVNKDVISNKCKWAVDITEKEWCNGVIEFIKDTFTIPYTWSHVSYYILGKLLKDKAYVLYTGEGADEIFGGYPGYKTGTPTPYSNFKLYNRPIDNKIQDKKVFIPVSSGGANLALGCSTVESRNPYLDLEFLNNKNYHNSIGKLELIDLYRKLFNIDPEPKQGFSGFPNEFYNYWYKKDISNFKDNSFWKKACTDALKVLTD